MSQNRWRYWYPLKEEIVDKDMPKLERIFRENNISRILDFGCGTGRHIIYFAERGFDVYGFDFDTYGIQRSVERLKERNLSANLIVYDMKKNCLTRTSFLML